MSGGSSGRPEGPPGCGGVVPVDESRSLPVCAHCGDRIGVYEPPWVEVADGTLHSSLFLNLDRYAPHARARVWHHACLAPPASRGVV